MRNFLLINAQRGDIAVQTTKADDQILVKYIKKVLIGWYLNQGVQGDPQDICSQLPANPEIDFTVKDRNTVISYSKSDDMFVVRFDRINIAADDPDITLEIVPMEFVPDLKISN